MAEKNEAKKEEEKLEPKRNNAPWGACPLKQPVPIPSGQSPLAIPLKGTATPQQGITLITPPCQGPHCQWFNPQGNHCIIWDITMALTVLANSASVEEK